MNEQTLDVDPAPDPTEPTTESRREPTAGPRPPWYRTPVSRDRDHRRLGGVVGGLSRAYGFEVRTTRIAVAIATPVLPVLVLVYLLAWIVLPPTPDRAVPLDQVLRDRSRLPLFVALALVILLGGVVSFGSWHLFGGLPWGIGLIAIGVLLWAAAGSRREPTAVPAPPAPTGATSPPTEELAPAAPARATWPAPAPPAPTSPTLHVAAPAAGLPAVTRRRWPIARISILVAGAFAAFAAGGDGLGWWDMPVLAGLVTVLAILAAGALLSALVNLRWLTITPLVLAVFAIVALGVTQPDLDGGLGSRTVRPATVDALVPLYRVAAGELTVDLRDVPLDAATPVALTARVGAGRLHVVAPEGAVLDIRAEIGAGHVVFDGREIASGVRHDESWTDQPQGTATGTIRLHLEVGMGEIAVDRMAADN